MVDHVFILAGGSGTRLWPASLRGKPKQFLRLKGGKSLLLLTIERARRLEPSGEIVVITTAGQRDAVVEECGLAGGRIAVLPEPVGRNTAPAIAAGGAYLSNRDGAETVLILPADHLIGPADRFAASVRTADALARQGRIVTFGIRPQRAETGYGYIEKGAPLGGGSEVASFREKPDEAAARGYVESGSYLWNSGMFCLGLGTLWEELAVHAPQIYALFSPLGGGPAEAGPGIRVVMESDEVRSAYEESPVISFDYAVMERSKRAAVVESDFDWNDVGSWDEIANLDIVPDDGVRVEVGSGGNFVYSDLPVVLCGVEGLSVVVKNGMVLVCARGGSQLVKDAVAEMGKRGLEDLL